MKVAVIGAGISGLVSVKSCIEEKLDVVCYESGSRIGNSHFHNLNKELVNS